MSRKRPYVLSLAGMDPSAGAGLLADIKTFEAHKVYGLGVCTAWTVQNDEEFVSVNWASWREIETQLEVLIKRFSIGFAKIGLIQNKDILETLILYLRQRFPNIQLIWDPILKASAGFEFHAGNPQPTRNTFSQLMMITPNWPEMQQLSGKEEPLQAAQEMSQYVHVYLKGGHRIDDPGKDVLFTREGKMHPFKGGKIRGGKHGSGCVLSAAILANLAQGYPLHRACLRAKGYTHNFLNSSPELLGYHKL